MKKRNGFTLVELLIVMTLVVILAMMMISVFNTFGVMDKAKDAQRKKDLNRIKISFEEYFNDNNCYPSGTVLSDLNDKTKCDSDIVFSPYLSPWPCDPDGQPYLIMVEGCNKFRVVTNLQNTKDNDIPTNWYTRTDLVLTGFTKENANFGVSSANILWYDSSINIVTPTPIKEEDSLCDFNNCASLKNGCSSVSRCTGGDDCYYRAKDGAGHCLSDCLVPIGVDCP